MLHFWYLNAQPKLVLININRNNLFYIFALWTFLSWCILKCIPPAGFHSSATGHSMKNWFCLFDLEMCDSFQKKFLAILLIRNGYCELVFLLYYTYQQASSQCSITTKVTEYIWKKHWMHWKFCAKAKNHAKNKELTTKDID